MVISIFEKICLQHFQKVHLSILPSSDWFFLAENKMVLSFVFWFWDWPRRPLADFLKFGYVKIRFGVPKSEWTSSFSSELWKHLDILKRKNPEKKKKPISHQMKKDPGYLSSPRQNLLTLQNFVKTTDGLQIDWVFVVWVVLVVFKPCKALAGEVKGWMSMNGFERMKRLVERPTVSG